MIHQSFCEWVESEVLPLQQSHADWNRLDGWQQGSNREIAGRFIHQNRTWSVHGDTRFKPVIAAYEAIRNKHHPNPFVIALTKTGASECLTLVQNIWSPNLPKHFYVYHAIGS